MDTAAASLYHDSYPEPVEGFPCFPLLPFPKITCPIKSVADQNSTRFKVIQANSSPPPPLERFEFQASTDNLVIRCFFARRNADGQNSNPPDQTKIQFDPAKSNLIKPNQTNLNMHFGLPTRDFRDSAGFTGTEHQIVGHLTIYN